MFSTADTIVAVATPPGRGGIGIVRLSGPDSPRIASTLMGRSRPFQPRRATFGSVRDAPAGGRHIDDVVVTLFQAPQSYTGEDVVEIGAHGNPVILERIVELAISAGARLAEPGEFTLRAHLNGRMDLVQAEAVVDLVNAVTPLQARAALDQLQGTLTNRIGGIERRLFDLIARLEASIDFPDEGFHFITRSESMTELSALHESLERLVGDGRSGRMVREGALVAIAGRPNVGKSSLFNRLVGSSRAIVTEVPGTTRDTLTELVSVEGLPVTLVDTAGLRDSTDAVELEGIHRARAAHAIAALTLVVVDGSAPLTAEDEALLRSCGPRLLVVNKSDLPAAWAPAVSDSERVVVVSAQSGEGIDVLRRTVASALVDRDVWSEPPAISNLRHLTLVEGARGSVKRAEELVASDATEELVLAELAEARAALELVTGRTAPDDLLHHIFSRFCIGK